MVAAVTRNKLTKQWHAIRKKKATQRRPLISQALRCCLSKRQRFHPAARFAKISNAGNVFPSSTSRNAPPPVEI